jgi:hypothetical protein
MAALVANPTPAHMEVAHRIRESLPDTLVTASHRPDSARALLFALALETDPAARDRQLLYIGQQLGAQVAAATTGLMTEVALLAPEQRLPVLLISFPALRQLTREERLQLMASLNGMLQREGRPSLQAYALRKLAQVHLRDDLEAHARIGKLTLSAVARELQVVFGVLAQQGHASETEARRAYEAGLHRLLPRERPPFAPLTDWQRPMDVALSRLDALAPPAKEQLIEGLTQTVAHDGKMTIGEAEILRVVCAVLHCPLPPLLK